MITCPSCKHSEYDGTLYCSECGARLWPSAGPDATHELSAEERLKTDKFDLPHTGKTSPLVGQLLIRIQGVPASLLLAGKAEYLLGRSDPKHKVDPDLDLGPYGGQQLGVSRRHATLQYDEGGLTVKDLGSTNGTQVNGQMLDSDEARRLRDGDEIRLGKLTLKVHFDLTNK